jgi:prolyl-tRNA synthetase
MHRWSQLFIPTLREAPADAEVASHKLLLRAGYVRQLGAGIYSYLFLGNRSINKIVRIIREEMDTIGQEFYLPALNPAEVWQESGRWTGMGDNMFRLKDRKGAELCLAMTHEEIMTSIARSELRSYKQLPQIWYQIQTKFRDEPRPKSGLLRVRQFLMKDAYSFDLDEAGLDESYRKHDATYRRIFSRCGLEFVAVDADSGSMGGSQSQEFMVYTDAGEDLIASARDANGNVVYAANLEKATSQLAPAEDLTPSGDGSPELVHTPNQRTIDEVGAFLGVTPVHQIKTMAYIVEHPESHAETKQVKLVGKTRAVVAFLRGDHQLNETKLAAIASAGADAPAELRPMVAEEIVATFGSPAGYLGPLGLQPAPHPRKPGVLVILDAALEGRTNLIAGANKEEYHLRNVTPMRDFKPTLVADIRNVNEGEPDPVSGEPLRLGKAVEIGHIFKLGYKYSKSMGASVLNRDGKEVTPIMGSYGIGVERILTAAIESSAARFAAHSAGDPKATEQYALPSSIAPFEVVVTVTNVKEPELLAAGEEIAAALSSAGFDVLLDDRDERAGVKFKDADLIGVPFRIAIGKKLADGNVELLNRLTGSTEDVARANVVQHLRQSQA